MRIRRITTMLLAVALCVTMMPSAAFAVEGGKTPPKSPEPAGVADTLAAEDLLAEGEHEEDELLVTFQEGTSKKKIGKVIDAQEATCEDILTVDGDKTARITIDGSGEEALQKTMQALAADPRVAEVQPNYRYKIAGKVTPDPFLDKKQETARYQYHMETVRAEKIDRRSFFSVLLYLGLIQEGLRAETLKQDVPFFGGLRFRLCHMPEFNFPRDIGVIPCQLPDLSIPDLIDP